MVVKWAVWVVWLGSDVGGDEMDSVVGERCGWW